MLKCNGEIKIYYLYIKTELVKTILAHQNKVLYLTLLSNDNFLLSASDDGKIKLWNLLDNN